MTTLTRATALRDSLRAMMPADTPLVLSRGKGAGKIDLVFDATPEYVYRKDGSVAGVDALIRAFKGGRGEEIRIDPHRLFVNPPTQVPDGGTRTVKSALGQELRVPTYRADPAAAFEEILRQSIADAPNAAGWRTRGTVTTVYSDTADGRINSFDNTYSNARAGASLGAASAETSSAIGQDFGTFVGGRYYCFQGFLGFDTSSIPDGDAVRSAILSLSLFSDGSTTDFTVNAHLKDWGASVTTADWVAGADLSAQTLLATLATSGLAAGYNAFAENGANFVNNVNKTGTTRLMLSSSRQAGNNTPTGAEFAYFYFADQTGTTNDPKLVITHGLAAQLVNGGLVNRGLINAGGLVA